MPTNKYSSIRTIIDGILPYSWAAVWFFPVFSLKISLLALWLFGFIVIIKSTMSGLEFNRRQLGWLAMPILLFSWYCISFLLSGEGQQDWNPLEMKSSLLLIPLLMLLAYKVENIDLKWAMRGFIASLIISGIHLISRATFLAISGAEPESYTYHGFTALYHLGAIYYSWYLSIAIIYILFRNDDALIAPFRAYLITGFMILLMMAASKLFIVMMVPLVIWKIIASPSIFRRRIRAAFIGAVLLFIASLPFLQRMNELGNGDLHTIMLEKYDYNTAVNGLTLRLIQWRFGIDILNETDAWATGTGPGRSQALLDEKYIEYGLYTGNADLGDSGYLGYNFHDQYIETMVNTGIPGVIILFGMMFLILLRRAEMYIFPLPAFIVTAIFFITESALERQAGIVIFTLMLSSLKNIQSPYSNRIQISERS